MNKDLSIDLYLHGDLKLHRGHISFLEYYFINDQHLLPAKHKFVTDLIKGGFIYEDQITDKGNSLIRELLVWTGVYEPKVKVKKVKVEYSPEFLEWWDLFPATDNFTYAGVEFNGTRSLRSKKDECAVKYRQIIEEGLSTQEVTHELLKAALTWEVEARKDQSVVRKANQLSFMNATLIWLNQRKFEAYIPLAKRGPYKPKSVDQNKVVMTTNVF